MVRRPSLRFVALFAAACAAAACSSTPALPRAVEVAPGTRTVVRLVQFATGRNLSLQNASSGSSEQVYSDRSTEQLRKVVADDRLQALLDVFAAKGMFARAGTATPDARDALVVEQGERRWIWCRHLPGIAPSEADFHEASAYFLSVYNDAIAFQAGDPNQPPDFASERNRAKSDGSAARRKLEGTQEQPR